MNIVYSNTFWQWWDRFCRCFGLCLEDNSAFSDFYFVIIALHIKFNLYRSWLRNKSLIWLKKKMSCDYHLYDGAWSRQSPQPHQTLCRVFNFIFLLVLFDIRFLFSNFYHLGFAMLRRQLTPKMIVIVMVKINFAKSLS